MRVHVWAGTDLVSLPAELTVEESPSGWVWQHQETLHFHDLSADERYPGSFAASARPGPQVIFCDSLNDLRKDVWAPWGWRAQR